MNVVTLEDKKTQSLSVSLGGQACSIRIVQRESFLYMDLMVNNVPILQGVPCLYGNKIVRYKHLGFSGDLFFLDNQGGSDPHYDGLGERYPLYYITEAELVQ